MKLWDLNTTKDHSFQDDAQLRENYIDRIYDTYIDEEELQTCDKTICQIADSLKPKTYTSREFIKEIGKYLKNKFKKKGLSDRNCLRQ